jgi:hypothetical protein
MQRQVGSMRYRNSRTSLQTILKTYIGLNLLPEGQICVRISHEVSQNRCCRSTIVLTLKFVHQLNKKKAILIPAADDTSILVYEKARSNQQYLAGYYTSFCIDIV